MKELGKVLFCFLVNLFRLNEDLFRIIHCEWIILFVHNLMLNKRKITGYYERAKRKKFFLMYVVKISSDSDPNRTDRPVFMSLISLQLWESSFWKQKHQMQTSNFQSNRPNLATCNLSKQWKYLKISQYTDFFERYISKTIKARNLKRKL